MTMTASTVRCSMGHTALFPGKNYVRGEWLRQLRRDKDVITISHGALDALSILGHEGRVLVCDIDPGVIASTQFMRGEGKGARYPHLNILPPVCCDIRDIVPIYVMKWGVRSLGAVDIDLACAVNEAWRIASPVVTFLAQEKYKGKVLLTFRNGRDGNGKGATEKRIAWIAAQLPKGVKVASFTKYRSDWIGRHATREMGSSMVIVELQF